MATVFRAYQVSIKRYVALKIIDLSDDHEERDEFRQRFAQEAKVVAMLEDIHILPIYGYGIVENEFAYIAMRLLRGGSLADLLRKGPLTPIRTADIFTQVGRGLSYAHSMGVIHRDLKASNILLDDTGNAYLCDFGLAKMIGSTLDLTRSGNLVGTPAYLAPELVRGESADHRSDIYSLGILLYHMLVGRPPFTLSDTGIAALLYKHIETPPPLPHLLNPAVTPGIEIVIMKALEKDRNKRYQSAEDMVQDFNVAVGNKPRGRGFITLRTPERLNLLTSKRTQVTRRLVLTLLLIVSLGLIVAAASILQNHPPDLSFTIIAGANGVLADVTPSESEIAAAKARLGDEGIIAFLACRLDNVSSAERARVMSDMAADMEMGFKVYDGNNDIYTQLTQIEQARLEGAKAIILCPLDPTLLVDAVDSLQSERIPLTYITLFNHPYGVKLDSSSYEIGLEVGRLGGQIFNQEQTGTARVVLLGSSGLPATERRIDGMQAGFKDLVPDAVFIGRYPGSTQDLSYQAIRDLIRSHVEFNVILGVGDVSAYGAIEAMQEANFDPKSVIVVSANGEVLARQMILDGTFLRGTVDVNIEQSAQLSMDASIKMLAGSDVPEVLSYPPGEILTREVLEAQGN